MGEIAAKTFPKVDKKWTATSGSENKKGARSQELG
jgi:hypothetical protein